MKSINIAIVALIALLINKYLVPFLFSLPYFVTLNKGVEIKHWVITFVIIPLITSGIFSLFLWVKSLIFPKEVESE